MENNPNTPPFLYSRFVKSFEQPGMVKWLLTEGWVRSEREALRVLILVFLICLSTSAIFFSANFSQRNFDNDNLTGSVSDSIYQ